MFQAVLELIWEFIVDWLLGFIWRLLLFPVVWLISLPFILVISMFGPRPYWLSVRNMLASVHVFWRGTVPVWALQ
jgi:hypothetical protein